MLESILLAAVLTCMPGETLSPVTTLPEGVTVHRSDQVVWSPDGKSVALTGGRDGDVFPLWFLDGAWHEGKAYAYINPPAFSDDSQHVAYSVGAQLTKKKERWSVLLDGKAQGKEDWIGVVQFMPGTDHVVYWTQPGAKLDSNGVYTGGAYVLHVGKKKGKKWKGMNALVSVTFSRDGSTAAGLAPKAGGFVVVLATPKKQWGEGKLVNFSSGLVLSADGSEWAVAEMVVDVTGNPKDWSASGLPPSRWYVLRGKERLGESFLSSSLPSFGPTAGRFAFRVLGSEGSEVVIEGEEPHGLSYDFVQSIVWETAGGGVKAGREGLAYIAIRSPEGSAASADLLGLFPPIGGKARVVCLDGSGEAQVGDNMFDEIRDLVVAPGGATQRNLTYRAKVKEKWVLVHEWSDAEGQHMVKSRAFRAIGAPVFTDDGVAAGALDQGEFSWLELTR
jgi:hypothetical protein